MKTIILSIIIFFLFGSNVLSQNSDNEQSSVVDFKEIKCVKVEYKIIYESASRDLFNFNQKEIEKDKLNDVLFEINTQTKDSFNLFKLILNAAQTKGYKVYSANDFDIGQEFQTLLTQSDIYATLAARTQTIYVENEYGYDTLAFFRPFDDNEIKAFVVKELLYLDYNGEIVKKELSGICPIRMINQDYDVDKTSAVFKKMFWIKFSDYLPVLENSKPYNSNLSYAQIFEQDKYFGINLSDNSFYQKNDDSYFSASEYQNIYANIFSKPQIPINNYPKINQKEIKYAQFVYKRIWEPSQRDTNYFSQKDIRKDEQNASLFFPKYPTMDYISLIDYVLDAIHNKGLTAYKASGDDAGAEYEQILTENELRAIMGEKLEMVFVENIDGELEELGIEIPYYSGEITSYLTQELYLYDKNNEIIQKRLIGICPIREYYKYVDYEENSPLYKKTFWIYFPEFQKIASEHFAYPYNCSAPENFEQKLFKADYFAVDLSDSNNFKYPINSINFQNLYANLPHLHNSPNDIYKNLTQNIAFPKTKKFKNQKIKVDNSAEIEYFLIDNTDNWNLFKPQNPQFGYWSLPNLIINKILYSGVKCYSDTSFTKQLSTSEILDLLGQTYDTLTYMKVDGFDTTVVILRKYNPEEISQFIFQEACKYDKKANLKSKKIISICPVREIYNVDTNYYETFWVKYSDIAPFLEKQNITKLSPSYFSFDEYINYVRDKKIFEPKYDESINQYLMHDKYIGKLIEY